MSQPYDADLTRTDPELVTVFENFAFEEVAGHGNLDARTRLLTQLAALIAANAMTQFRQMIEPALQAGVTPVELKEVTYQAVPYVGMGRALEFVLIANEVLAEQGIELPLAGQSTTTPDTRLADGRQVQGEIVGHDNVDAMYDNAPADLAHIQRYLSGNCFGDFLTRTGLDLATRELVTLSFLAALGGADAQVKGHVNGNLNVGNGRERMIEVVTQLLPFIGYPRTLNAINVINDVVPPDPGPRKA